MTMKGAMEVWAPSKNLHSASSTYVEAENADAVLTLTGRNRFPQSVRIQHNQVVRFPA
jgi:hypothetical protein